jgi:hypothetical protein
MELAQALLYRLLIHSSSMKTVVLLSFLFNSFIATFSADVSDDIAAAVRTGNAAAIAKYFAASVDLKVLDQENIYSKAQAELILKDFFSKHSLKTFNIAHKSVLKNDSQFAIGTLETTNGKFRVNFVMKTAAGVSTITQFRIEHEDE